MSKDIKTVWIETDSMVFEVEVCGDQHSKKLALFLHGFPECAYSWRYQMPLMAALGYKCWAPNQRGYGRTTRPKGVEHYALKHLVNDVWQLIDQAHCDQVLLIGHDWGGEVLWGALIEKLRKIDQAIVMNAPHPFLFRKNMSLKQLLRSWYIAFFQIPWLPERVLVRKQAAAMDLIIRGTAVDKDRFTDDVIEVYKKNLLIPGAATGMINWYRALFRYGSKGLKNKITDKIHTPVLMIWGEQDIVLGTELTYGTEQVVDNLTLRYIPHSGHWVQQETPVQVNEIIEAWLAGKPVPGLEKPSEKE